MGKKKKQHINNLNEYIKTAESRAKYSLERFDILIITLSSGGIALSMSFFENFKEINKTQVYIGCVFFAIAVIINLLSQITGYYANRFDIMYSIQEVRELKKSLKGTMRSTIVTKSFLILLQLFLILVHY